MVRPKKHLGQHFLKDESVSQRISEAIPKEGFDQIVEIGPGTGALTKYLLQLDSPLVCFEVDEESVAYLNEHYPSLEVRSTDFLKADLESFGKQLAVVGNFPYNISSQIMFHSLANRTTVPVVLGMFQREVARRICEPVGSKDYGILSVMMQAYYQCEYLFTVSEHVFNPPPKVKSGVIRCVRYRTELPCDDKLFHRVVKTAFNQRRKTLRNSIKSLFTGELGEFSGKRPEQLSVDEFIALTQLVEANS